VSHEVRSYLCSLAGPRVARILNHAVRAPWGSENSRHWTLDVAFGEDESRVRTGQAAPTLSQWRRRALTLLPHEGTTRCGSTAQGLTAGGDHRYVLQVLAS
jgi:predicted transposase YbfD/YdcC